MYNRILQGLTTEKDAEEFKNLLDENKHLKKLLFGALVVSFSVLVLVLTGAIVF